METPLRENNVTLGHGSCSLRVMGSWQVKLRNIRQPRLPVWQSKRKKTSSVLFVFSPDPLSLALGFRAPEFLLFPFCVLTPLDFFPSRLRILARPNFSFSLRVFAPPDFPLFPFLLLVYAPWCPSAPNFPHSPLEFCRSRFFPFPFVFSRHPISPSSSIPLEFPYARNFPFPLGVPARPTFPLSPWCSRAPDCSFFSLCSRSPELSPFPLVFSCTRFSFFTLDVPARPISPIPLVPERRIQRIQCKCFIIHSKYFYLLNIPTFTYTFFKTFAVST